MDIEKIPPFNPDEFKSLPRCIVSDTELTEVIATVFSATFFAVVVVLFVAPLLLRFSLDVYYAFIKPKITKSVGENET